MLFMATLAGGNNDQPDLALCISGFPFQWKKLRIIYIYMIWLLPIDSERCPSMVCLVYNMTSEFFHLYNVLYVYIVNYTSHSSWYKEVN